MKKSLKYIMIKAVLVGVFLAQTIGLQAAPSTIQVELNQKTQEGISPIIEKGTTLVPLRSVGDLLGANVHWDGPTQVITIVQAGVTNTLTLNKTIAYKEDESGKSEIHLSLPPVAKNGTTYVPLRYIAESLDVKVGWDQESKTVTMNEFFEYKNQKIFFADPVVETIELLGQPSFKMKDESYTYLFYVDDYKNPLILYCEEDKITGFVSNAETMKFREITYEAHKGDPIRGMKILRDDHDGNKIVGLGTNMIGAGAPTKASILANERIIFELTNGFRAHNNKAPLRFNEKLSDVARRHSKDMADQNYFSHTSLDGTSMSQRITRGGISWVSCGENIAAGNQAALDVFGQWLNSLGHRKNMLNQSGDLGVGSAYKGTSTYRYYHTQNFANLR